MNESAIYIIGVIIAVAWLTINFYVSWKLHQSYLFDSANKKYQYLVIWLIPFIGAFTTIYFLKDTLSNSGPTYINENRKDDSDRFGPLGGGRF